MRALALEFVSTESCSSSVSSDNSELLSKPARSLLDLGGGEARCFGGGGVGDGVLGDSRETEERCLADDSE